jgi:hypothetical protein
MRNAYKIVIGKAKWKTPLKKPRRRWKDNIRMDIIEIGREGVDWIYTDQDRDSSPCGDRGIRIVPQ